MRIETEIETPSGVIRHVIENGVVVLTTFVDQSFRFVDGARRTADLVWYFDAETGAATGTSYAIDGVPGDVVPVFGGTGWTMDRFLDDPDTRGWSSWTNWRDAGGHAGSEIVWDDGRTELRLVQLVEGKVETFSARTADPLDAYPWLFQWKEFSDPGVLSLAYVMSDDLVETYTEYNEARRPDHVLEVDHGDVHAWATRTTRERDPFFLETSDYARDRTVMFDDGTEMHWLSEYNSEDRLLYQDRFWIDHNDVHAWDERYETFGEGGVILERNTVWDDGRESWTDFLDGKLQSKAVEDWQDAHAWISKEWTWDDEGRLYSRTISWDNGVVGETYFQNGRRDAQFANDFGDAYDWSEKEMQFDASGLLSERRIVWDNGVVGHTYFLAGIRDAQFVHDFEDVQEWSEKEMQFDASGLLSERLVVWDNGVEGTTYFEDGIRTHQEIADAADAFDWDRKDLTFDAEGRLASETIVWDDSGTADTLF